MTVQQRFLLGGYGNFLFDFDVDRKRILRQISISDEQSDCILIKSSASAANATGRAGVLCTGATNGLIILRDPTTLKSIHRFHPHSGNLSDFDVNGNLLVSCGFALTRSGLQVDRFLMCYDLRMMRALNPIQMLIEPCYLHFLPVCSSVVAVASQVCRIESLLSIYTLFLFRFINLKSGCFLLTDTNLMNSPSTIYQAQLPPISGIATTFSMSSNCQAFAFGHSSGITMIYDERRFIMKKLVYSFSY
jgi:PAB-dependent poly(A)-specific ribonuclease subunit 2